MCKTTQWNLKQIAVEKCRRIKESLRNIIVYLCKTKRDWVTEQLKVNSFSGFIALKTIIGSRNAAN